MNVSPQGMDFHDFTLVDDADLDQLIGSAGASSFELPAETRARLLDLGARTSTIAHELRQPLYSIAIAAENLRLLLSRETTDPERSLRSVGRIAQQVQRAQTIIDRILAHASGAVGDEQGADLSEAAESAVQFLAPLFEGADIAVEQRWPFDYVPVGLDRIELEQIFVNVLRNAIDSIQERRRSGWGGRGRIVVAINRDRGKVCCEVTDNGAGLAKGMADAMLQPFVTTKRQGGGTGLGLHICRQMLARAGGTIRLRPRDTEQGACVDIRVPLVSAEAPRSDVFAA